MEIITLARPYAKAAFDVAHQAKSLEPWGGALNTAAAIAADSQVEGLLGDPAVEDGQLHKLFSIDQAPDGFDNFIALLVENDRLALLPPIAGLFDELKADAEQALLVTVRSASSLEDGYKQRLKESLGTRFGKKIELDCEIDETLLGGAVIQAGDLVIDGSLRGKLQRLGDALVN